MENIKLNKYRKYIDIIDKKIVSLINKRINYVSKIAKIKDKNNIINYTDKIRENDQINKLLKDISNIYLKDFIKNIFNQFFTLSKNIRSSNAILNIDISIGIIGYGRFGATLHNIIKQHIPKAKIYIYSKDKKIDNKIFFDLNHVCKCKWLFLSIPISEMISVLNNIKKHITKNTIVIDVCSVKVLPVKWMKKILKKQQIIATHPMFGPDSTSNGTYLYDMNMMMYNISTNIDDYNIFKLFWQKLGVNVIEITPDLHDKYCAYTICYNHLIGRIGQYIGIKPTPIDTKGFSIIYNAMQYVVNDSMQLFVDMQSYNPYSQNMRKKFLKAYLYIEKQIKLLSKNK